MRFCVKKVASVALNMVAEALTDTSNVAQITKLYLKGYSNIHSLEDALAVVDAKRISLTEPYGYAFLCLEITYGNGVDENEMFLASNKVADSINAYFNDDLFVISLLGYDEYGIPHSVIIISEFEKSLDRPSHSQLPADVLYNLVASALPGYLVGEITEDAVYLFDGDGKEMEYRSVAHLICHTRKTTVQSARTDSQ